ncbi:hypothetical protein R3P38DRAFT_3178963 [Favolaschia claudopus]|uniref:Uncharacterized protein n=1 Tax=Favolaschia claudopus TaxID=2862362 RepID=A0AAW0CR33_9AGAR
MSSRSYRKTGGVPSYTEVHKALARASKCRIRPVRDREFGEKLGLEGCVKAAQFARIKQAIGKFVVGYAGGVRPQLTQQFWQQLLVMLQNEFTHVYTGPQVLVKEDRGLGLDCRWVSFLFFSSSFLFSLLFYSSPPRRLRTPRYDRPIRPDDPTPARSSRDPARPQRRPRSTPPPTPTHADADARERVHRNADARPPQRTHRRQRLHPRQRRRNSPAIDADANASTHANADATHPQSTPTPSTPTSPTRDLGHAEYAHVPHVNADLGAVDRPPTPTPSPPASARQRRQRRDVLARLPFSPSPPSPLLSSTPLSLFFSFSSFGSPHPGSLNDDPTATCAGCAPGHPRTPTSALSTTRVDALEGDATRESVGLTADQPRPAHRIPDNAYRTATPTCFDPPAIPETPDAPQQRHQSTPTPTATETPIDANSLPPHFPPPPSFLLLLNCHANPLPYIGSSDPPWPLLPTHTQVPQLVGPLSLLFSFSFLFFTHTIDPDPRCPRRRRERRQTHADPRIEHARRHRRYVRCFDAGVCVIPATPPLPMTPPGTKCIERRRSRERPPSRTYASNVALVRAFASAPCRVCGASDDLRGRGRAPRASPPSSRSSLLLFPPLCTFQSDSLPYLALLNSPPPLLFHTSCLPW